LNAEIDARDGKIHEYRLLNICTILPAVNRERSKFRLIPNSDKIIAFERLVLIDECMKAHSLARCDEYKSYLLVADDLAISIRKAGIIGLQLTEPSEIRP
jgi:hypothetical protein